MVNETQSTPGVKPKKKEPLLDAEFLRRLERLAIVAKKVHLGATKGERRSKRKGSSTEFADYREYVQGDDLRFVDWNIYGRLEALYLKLFMENEDLTVSLLIDGSRSMSYGTPSKYRFSIRLAAAIGYVALAGYDRVCVEIFNGHEVLRLPPIRGKTSAGKLFSFLENAEPDGETHLGDVCRGHVIRNRAKGLAILISDFFDPEGYEEPFKRLLQTRSDIYGIHVLAPEEIKPDLSGDLKLVDSETGSEVEISVSGALLKRYGKNRDGFCESIRRYCVARGIGYFPASSDMAVDRLTLDVLRRGGMMR